MRIRQGRISNSLIKFKKAYLEKFNLKEPFDHREPVVFFGMYNDNDYAEINKYIHKILIVWCGSDSLMINAQRRLMLYKANLLHIAKNEFISADLKRLTIPHIIKPISWQRLNIEPVPLGDNIFHYGRGDFYGEQYLDEIEKKTGIEIIKTDKNTFHYNELMEVYKNCFINLRLTKHDGLPNTVLEMGMMGRKSIYNGGIPSSIKYKTVDDIIRAIIMEYQNRHEADYLNVSSQIKEFLTMDDNWLDV